MAKDDIRPKCFIIMPITTPQQHLSRYGDDPHHFDHVLQCLFEPAITELGYEPIVPRAKGARLIHATIVEQLESADLVLCDMSTVNANVFFEWGIRIENDIVFLTGKGNEVWKDFQRQLPH